MGKILFVLCLPAAAQWTLPEVVERASRNYAGIQVSAAELRAAAARIQQVRTEWLPKGDFLAQVNRATRNNVFGMLLPQTVIAPISGPALESNAGTNVWGAATGFLISWEPFDLGQRNAHVAEAEAARAHSEKALLRTRFEVESAAAEAFFTVLAADQTVAGAKAAAGRAAALEKIVASLAGSGLKPEADAARARGELAAAQGQVVQAEQTARLARAALIQFTGDPVEQVAPVPGPFFQLPPAEFSDAAVASHPALDEQAAALAQSVLRRKNLDYRLYPKFALQSGAYARGTGAHVDGSSGGGAAGLAPNIYNWGAGFSVTVPLFELPVVRAQREVEQQRVLAEQARASKINQDLRAQVERARALLAGARQLAAVTPRQLDAARATEQQARARYQAGLTNLVDVADAQRFLLQAEIDDGLARLAIWRAHLALAVAQGSLQPVLDAARR